MKTRSSGYSSDTEQNKQQDLSLLRKPILTASVGFLEAKNAYDNGTDEIRRLLAHECDIIYECNVCRNLFRSFANFLSHKRVYCQSAHKIFHSQSNGFIDHDTSTLIQTDSDFINKASNKLNKNNNINKDLSGVIEFLLKRQETSRVLKLSDLYDQVNEKLIEENICRQNHILQLDKVPNSKVAVFQTVKKEDNDNIGKEVGEVNDLKLNEGAILGPDGKVLPNLNNAAIEVMPGVDGATFKLEKSQGDINDIFTCDVCKREFTTEKTLKLHIESKHINSTYVYQCPNCSSTFLQPGAVIRHLNKDHQKSMRRIRFMRETILKKRLRVDKIPVKGPSRELARLQIQNDSEKREAENKAWVENVENSKNLPMCVYCHKTFERKAVLTTHLNSCSYKNSKKFEEIPAPTTGTSNNHLVAVKNEDAKLLPDNQNIAPEIISSTKEKKSEECIDSNISNTLINNNSDANKRISENEPFTRKRKRRKMSKIRMEKSITNESESSDVKEILWNMNEKLSIKSGSVERETPSPPKIAPPENDTSSNVVTKNSEKDVYYYCKICEKRFDVISNLRRHISMFHYRRRRFGCEKCDYRAFRKYDVINHLSSQHSIVGEEFVHKYLTQEEKITKNEENVDADVVIAKNGDIGRSDNAVLNTSSRGNKPKRRNKRSKVCPSKPKIESSPENTQSIPSRQPSPEYAQPKPSVSPQPPEEDQSSEQSVIKQKLTRSASGHSLFSVDEALPVASKRPIRNRVKPINKDFVYDLTNLLKKDVALARGDHSIMLIPLKSQKRRSTTVSEESSNESLVNGDVIEVKPKPDVKGWALKMAKLAVDKFTAMFDKHVELMEISPERSAVTPVLSRSLSDSSGTEIAEPVVEDSEYDDESPIKQEAIDQLRRVSDNILIQALNKKRKIENSLQASSPVVACNGVSDHNNKKPSSLPNNQIKLVNGGETTMNNKIKDNTNTNSVDNNMETNSPLLAGTNHVDSETSVQNDLKEIELLKEYVMKTLSQPLKKVIVPSFSETSENCSPPVPPSSNSISVPNDDLNAKRITLIQRLTENRNKKILESSLLKTALEK